MAMAETDLLDRFRRSQPAGIFLDFDGTLSEIVARPEEARPMPRAGPILEELTSRHELVAVVSGRRTDDVRSLLGVHGVQVFGLYGVDEFGGEGIRPEVRGELDTAVVEVSGAWVEDKGASLAVHYRAAADPSNAEASLRPALQAIADGHGLLLLPGKMVLELAPAHTPGKGAVVLRQARSRGLRSCLYAGDDRADLVAFSALDELRAEGIVTVKVAVRSEETPRELVDAADVVVDRPSGLLELLARL